MNTKITLHDNVHKAIGEVLFPLEGTDIIASKNVNSCSDFELDRSKSEYPYSIIVCSIPYTVKRNGIDKFKLEIQIEEWINFLQIILGYKVQRYLSVLVQTDTDNCIKTVASVSRGDDCRLKVKTLSDDINRVLNQNGIMLAGNIVIQDSNSMDSDLSHIDNSKEVLTITKASLKPIADKEDNLFTEVTTHLSVSRDNGTLQRLVSQTNAKTASQREY